MPRVRAGDGEHIHLGPRGVCLLHRHDRGHRLLRRVRCGRLLCGRLHELRRALLAVRTRLHVTSGVAQRVDLRGMLGWHCDERRRHVHRMRSWVIQPQLRRRGVYPVRSWLRVASEWVEDAMRGGGAPLHALTLDHARVSCRAHPPLSSTHALCRSWVP